jgi:aminopeptidase N
MKKILFLVISLVLIAGCSIFGVHFKIHNPNRAGKFPKKTEARVLMGNQDSKFRSCYDVKYYYLSVHFPKNLLKEKNIQGSVSIKSEAVADFDTLQLNLAEHMNIATVYEADISAAGSSVSEQLLYYRKANALFVVMKQVVKKGQTFGLIIDYNGTPTEAKRPPWRGGFVRKEDNLKKPWWGVACETEGASSWWPCKDVVNDEPDSVDVDFWVPKGYTAVSNGKIVAASKRYFSSAPGADHELVPWSWHISYPINIYNITFYIGNFKLLHDTYYSEVTHDTLQLNHYVLEQNYEIAKTHFQQLKKYLAFYEETFGPYPWYRDGFKLVESPYAGMEHQSAIAYGNGYHNDQYNGFDYIILHETAHEWWGNSVTANDLAEGWIHEGFATYAEALYVEKTKGHPAYINYILNNRLLIVNRRPLVGEKGIRYFNYHDGDIYNKGSWVLHSLRYAVGNDSLFFDILHSFYMENKYSQISSDKLEEVVNRKTGKDFHWFFEQYLHNRFVPQLDYYIKDNILYYQWNQQYTNADFNQLKIKVTGIITADPHSRVDYSGTYNAGEITPTSSIGSLKIQPGTTVYFGDRDVLIKTVENKSLAKEFQKQK